MTLQNLSRILDKYEQKLGSPSLGQFELLKGIPFYIWQNPQDIRTLNHIIGLPQKNGKSHPLFDYEQLVFDTLQDHKHLWIKKATGLGITEFMLRYMAWLCFSRNIPRNSQMCIVTGPRIELAITLIDRMKGLFKNREFLSVFDSKETVLELNGVHIEAYPSHHLDSMRGLTNVSFIYLDEADFFPPGQQSDARDVSERYIAKSNHWIVMVSTPNAPDGLFEKIEREPEDTCLYKKLFLDYAYGLDKMHTREEIALTQKSRSIEREYNLKYLGEVGNVFHTLDIVAAKVTEQQGQEMLDWSTSTMVARTRYRWEITHLEPICTNR